MSDSAASDTQTADEAVLAELLVKTLSLQDVTPANIAPLAPLFGFEQGSLGLDSIDALEIALAVEQQYGVELRSDDPGTILAFASLRDLTAYVLRGRNRG